MKTIAVEAWRETFDQDYPVEDFRGLLVDIEFPIVRESYPSIWVDWEPVGAITPAGIGHKEYVELDGGRTVEVRRSRFGGVLTYTAVALTSLERDRLLDEMVRTLAHGDLEVTTSDFWAHVENNGLIGVNVKKDEIEQRGFSAAPGTPWGGSETVYEGTLATECVGEFVSEPSTLALLRISDVIVEPYDATEGDPSPGDDSWR